MESLPQQITHWPTQPGIYMMRDEHERILYVGKAKNLKNRIRSYFQAPEQLTPKTRILMKRVRQLEFTVTQTELEALLMECNLIKKHRPRFNIRLKDDKNYPYFVLDFTHPFPRFRTTRKVVISPSLKYFGPYSAGATEISRFLLKAFQIRDCSDSKFSNRSRPCLNYEIGTCTAPCVDLVSDTAYSLQIRQAILFLKGKKTELLKSLKKEMKTASDQQKYEDARRVRDKIQALEKITAKQNAVLTDKIKDIDVIGCFRAQESTQWIILFIRGGFLTGRFSQKTNSVLDSDDETARSFIEQYYTQNIPPNEVWLAEDFKGRENTAALLAQKTGAPVPLLVKRGERALRLLGMAQQNARLIFEDKEKTQTASELLQQVLSLAETPYAIEGIDVSNLQGTHPAVALVHFAAESPLKSRYRVYYPKTVEGQDDYASIFETLSRRLRDKENAPPDLFIIDGGKGQLASAIRALKELESDIPVCAIAKARTESAFTRKDIKQTQDRIFVPGRKNPILLRENNPALRLVQRVRDEAHRFSVKSHHTRKRKATLESSPLTDIPGIGPKTKAKLLKKFGNIDAIRSATEDELRAAGLNSRQIRYLLTCGP